MKNILIIGGNGQIGTDLTFALRQKYTPEQIISSDIRKPGSPDRHFELLDATDYNAVKKILVKHRIDEVYLMAAILSAKAESMPNKAWEINMKILFNAMELAKEGLIKKLFWPSSIAVFGPHTPRTMTPQYTVMDPNTVYGISKLAGERWIEYYNEHFGTDIRSVRYPGIISWKTLPGGGTTDYAVEIFYEALKHKHYTSFLSADTRLPMMYMPDAIQATIDIMEVEKEKIRIKNSYNVAGISFTPAELAQAIQKYIPEFRIDYQPDFRQAIADSWPASIDDSQATQDWQWQHQYDLDNMVKDMLYNLEKKLSEPGLVN